MYTVNKNCSSALKFIQQNATSLGFKNVNQQDLNLFKFNREQIRQNVFSSYSTKPTYKPIKKLMVANRGWCTLIFFFF